VRWAGYSQPRIIRLSPGMNAYVSVGTTTSGNSALRSGSGQLCVNGAMTPWKSRLSG
jgi:hypothetical protein